MIEFLRNFCITRKTLTIKDESKILKKIMYLYESLDYLNYFNKIRH